MVMFVSGVVGWPDVKQLQFCDGGLILNLKNNVQKKSDTFPHMFDMDKA